MSDNLKVRWIDSGREPRCAPDPAYPRGKDVKALRLNLDDRTCRVELPYPARRCGQYLITCSACGLQAIVTTAGRPDDPRSFTISCNPIIH